MRLLLLALSVAVVVLAAGYARWTALRVGDFSLRTLRDLQRREFRQGWDGPRWRLPGERRRSS